MRLRTLAIAATALATTFGGVAGAEAKPHEKKLKECKQSGHKLHCKGSNGQSVKGVCPVDYDAVQVVELGPDAEATDVNGNLILCFSSTLGTIDDTPAS